MDMRIHHTHWNASLLKSASFIDFLNLIPEAVILSTESGQVILTNYTAQTLFQYTADEFLTCVIEDLVPDNIRKHHPQLRAKFFNYPKPKYIYPSLMELRT
jgi:hypothetical protein